MSGSSSALLQAAYGRRWSDPAAADFQALIAVAIRGDRCRPRINVGSNLATRVPRAKCLGALIAADRVRVRSRDGG
jgi:hypothetical protein